MLTAMPGINAVIMMTTRADAERYNDFPAVSQNLFATL